MQDFKQAVVQIKNQFILYENLMAVSTPLVRMSIGRAYENFFFEIEACETFN